MNLNPFNWFKKEDPDPFLLEAQDIFKKKGNPVSQKDLEKIKGEGFEELGGFGVTGLHSYSTFYNRYINQQFESENEKIREYRKMADMPEIADVIEDAVNESTQVDDNGKVLHLEFLNKELANNTNVVDNITKEFNDFFYSKLRIQDLLDDLFYSYYTDGRLYCECIINPNNSKEGIQKLKKLPAESMDFEYDRTTGQILHFYQYLKPGCKRPDNRAEAEKDPHIIVFEPKQILHLTFGKFGKSKKEVFGFLEKAKQPFNQLKLLETSVIIYRIVRAPERFVFKIDVGNMPRDKALKYVEKIKQKFNKKMVYDPQTGQMAYDTNVMSMLENFFVPQCLSLNTRIPLLTGEIKTLADLIEDHKNGIINEVYSIDQNTLKPIRGFVQWAGITRKDAELIRVHLDNGEFIDCTPDHRFVLRDGSECEAQYLTEGASLMPLYKKTEAINSHPGAGTYEQILDPSDNTWKFSHRIFGNPKEGCAIHHKNFNRFDNSSGNLITLPTKDHIELHFRSNKERNSHLPMLEALKDPNVRAKQKAAASKAMKKRFMDPSEKEKMAILMKAKWENDEFRAKAINASKQKRTEKTKRKIKEIVTKLFQNAEYKKKHAEASKNRWNNPEFRNKMSIQFNDEILSFVKLGLTKCENITNLLTILNSNEKFVSQWNELNPSKRLNPSGKIGRRALVKIVNLIQNEQTPINHKVTKIERLSHKEDTGCLTVVDENNNHNFALAAGVFVKNSENRGSDISTIGGNPGGFAQLDDLRYFANKLYRAMKYPISRVNNAFERADSNTLFNFGGVGEINRDEIKWAKFLQKHQSRICKALCDLFLLHLEFKGLKKQFNLDDGSLSLAMNAPNNYEEHMRQKIRETTFLNYNTLAVDTSFSKSFLMRKYLKYDDDTIKANIKGFEEDKQFRSYKDDMADPNTW